MKFCDKPNCQAALPAMTGDTMRIPASHFPPGYTVAWRHRDCALSDRSSGRVSARLNATQEYA